MCKTYIAHNSIEDTIVLSTNLKTVNVAFLFHWLSSIVNSCHTKKTNLATLHYLVTCGQNE